MPSLKFRHQLVSVVSLFILSLFLSLSLSLYIVSGLYPSFCVWFLGRFL